MANAGESRPESCSKPGEVAAWRWFLAGILFVLFPLVFHPWWLAITSIAVYTLLVALLIGKPRRELRPVSINWCRELPEIVFRRV
jgi:hypothetical protein